MAEHGKLAELQVVAAAEEQVADARMVSLLVLQVTAKRRLAAAEGQLTQALKSGGCDNIAAARQHCQATGVESERVCDEAIEEMFHITRAGADRFDLFLDQYVRWQDAADAEVDARLGAEQ
jgi:hypothetical protein